MQAFHAEVVRSLVAMCFATAAFHAAAQPTEAAKQEFAAALQAAVGAGIAGPTEIKLVDQAVLRLPDELTYVPAAQAARLLSAMGNLGGEGLLGMVIAQKQDWDWFVVMRLFKSGYIRDDEARQ